MKTFEITLKNEKEKSYRLIILLLVVLHVLLFSLLLFDNGLWRKAVSALVLTVLYSGYRLLITRTAGQKFTLGSGYFIVMAIFFTDNIWWLGLIDFILSILSGIAVSPVMYSFTPEQVKKVPFPFKKYQWNQFSNVILKDNILTLDFKTNKLLQAEVDTKNIDDQAFNTFAKEQLIKNN
jgi:hypothetical protein